MQLPWTQSWQPAGTRIKVLVLQLMQLALPLIFLVLLAHSLWVLCSTVDDAKAKVHPKAGGKAPAAIEGLEAGGNEFSFF